MIAEGRVAKDGVALTTAATLLTSLHGVTVDGEPVAETPPPRLFIFHKPPGVLTTEHDPRGRPTIYDRLPRDLPRLVPVGRLDYNTEGLLLMTNDGGLKRQLELPATGVERAYRARAFGQVSQQQLESLIEGVEIDGIRYGSIDANIERRTGANLWIEMILTEGKNREVRRVLEHLGLEVNRLIRIRYGPFVLADLPVGAIGEIRQNDLVAFRQSLERKGMQLGAIAVTASASSPASRPRRKTDAGGPRSARPVSAATAPAPATDGKPRPGSPPGATPAARPARPPQRKAGWARPKPRPGPGKPRK